MKTEKIIKLLNASGDTGKFLEDYVVWYASYVESNGNPTEPPPPPPGHGEVEE